MQIKRANHESGVHDRTTADWTGLQSVASLLGVVISVLKSASRIQQRGHRKQDTLMFFEASFAVEGINNLSLSSSSGTTLTDMLKPCGGIL